MSGLRVICCGTQESTYALDISCVHSIQPAARLRWATQFWGPMAWFPSAEGEVEVYGLSDLLGIEAMACSLVHRLLLVRSQAGLWGLYVDSISRPREIADSRVVQLPPIITNSPINVFEGVIGLDDQFVLLLSPDRLHPETATIPESLGEEGDSSEPAWRVLPPNTGRSAGGRLVLFTVAEEQPGERPLTFGLSIAQISEILDPLPVMPVPGPPPFVRGLARWRGVPVPIIDLAMCLGLPSSPAAGGQRLIVARGASEGAFVGFLVRPSMRTLRLPVEHEPSERDLPLHRSLLWGVYELAGETLAIPDVERIWNGRGNTF